MDVEKILIVDDEEEFPAIARLIELGRQKSYVTLDDILHFFPEAEQDVEQLEEAFSALLSAGIPFMEDTITPEPTEDELAAVEQTTEPEDLPDPSLDLLDCVGVEPFLVLATPLNGGVGDSVDRPFAQDARRGGAARILD